jgi:hypothetical protein
MDGITKADLIDWDSETLRDTAACYGFDLGDLSDDDARAAFGEFLDDLAELVS